MCRANILTSVPGLGLGCLKSSGSGLGWVRAILILLLITAEVHYITVVVHYITPLVHCIVDVVHYITAIVH